MAASRLADHIHSAAKCRARDRERIVAAEVPMFCLPIPQMCLSEFEAWTVDQAARSAKRRALARSRAAPAKVAGARICRERARNRPAVAGVSEALTHSQLPESRSRRPPPPFLGTPISPRGWGRCVSLCPCRRFCFVGWVRLMGPGPIPTGQRGLTPARSDWPCRRVAGWNGRLNVALTTSTPGSFFACGFSEAGTLISLVVRTTLRDVIPRCFLCCFYRLNP